MTRRHVLCALAALSAFAFGCTPTKSGDKASPTEGTLRIFAASSTADAIDEIRAKFTAQHRTATRSNYAASSTLAQQIVHGAEADVFLSAAESWADELAQRGLVGKRRDLLSNDLVVIVPKDSPLVINELDDLRMPGVERIALGDPAAVPAGVYARQALEKRGVWDQLKAKIVAAADVRQALAFVETGGAQAGIVFQTDALVSDKVRVAVEVDAGLMQPIRYPLVLVRRVTPNPQAAAFYDYLAGPEAAEVFRRFGFTVLDSDGPTRPTGETAVPAN